MSTIKITSLFYVVFIIRYNIIYNFYEKYYTKIIIICGKLCYSTFIVCHHMFRQLMRTNSELRINAEGILLLQLRLYEQNTYFLRIKNFSRQQI